jgi:hypothetical protein
VPFVIEKDTEACSADKPYAVKTKGTGSVHGCHATKKEAEAQQAALYSNVTDASARIAARAAQEERAYMAALAAEQTELPEPEITYEHEEIVLCRLPDVPIMHVGMDWPAMYGAETFGASHIESAVEAFADPMIPRPRVKLGHIDPRYNPHPCPQCHAEIPPDLDGDPGFGFLEGLVLERNSTVLAADFVDIPLWLAKVMPVAYPTRSIEGWFKHQGPNKKEYPFVLTGCSLGSWFPAILTLPDLPALYGSEPPDFVKEALVS